MLKKCEIRECGARVLVVTVGGHPFAVNPKSVEMVVDDGEGNFRLVSGFEPHRYTCVNIGDRIARHGLHGN